MKEWPTPQDYNEAIQNPHLCFHDPDLKQATIALNALGLPRSSSGTFASVFKATTPTGNWAVRCFLTNRREHKSRYEEISKFVLFDDLESTVDFYYLDQGIKVRGDWYPCLKMLWVDGVNLDRYIEDNFKDTNKMTELLKQFHKLVGELEGAGIGHGDLQHGNIIVTSEGLRLVDYDALFVPALHGLSSLEFGHPNYQHPKRTEHHYDPDVDNFSCWLIHASLLAIAIDPKVYSTTSGGDDNIIFKRKDLEQPDQSAVFELLLNHDSEYLRETALLLKRMLRAAPTAIPYLGAPRELIEQLLGPQDGINDNVQLHLPDSDATSDNRKSDRNETSSTEVRSVATDLSSTHKIIGDSKTARKKRKQPAKGLIAGIFTTGRAARDRIKQIADKQVQVSMPDAWLRKKNRIATANFDQGDYELAASQYLEIFKVLDDRWQTEPIIDIAIKLGYSYSLAGSPALASNYFLLALSSAKQNAAKQELLLKAAFLSIVNKFDDGNKEAGWKIYRDNLSHFNSLSSFIARETGTPFIARPTTFYALTELAERVSDKDESGRIIELLASASLLLCELMAKCPERCDEQFMDSALKLTRRICNAPMGNPLEQGRRLHTIIALTCEKKGYIKQAQIASFNSAVIANVLEPSQSIGLPADSWVVSGLKQLGHEWLFNLANQSAQYVPPSHILKLLISLHETVKYEDNQKGKETMPLAYRFAREHELEKAFLPALENEDFPTISYCIARVDDCSDTTEGASVEDEDLERLFQTLVELNCVNVLRAVVLTLASRGMLDRMAALFVAIAAKKNHQLFEQIVRVTADELPQSGIADPQMKSCLIAVKQTFYNLDELSILKPESKGEKDDVFRLAVEEIETLNTFRIMFGQIGIPKAKTEIMTELVDVRYERLLHGWFLNCIDTKEIDKLTEFISSLADMGQAKTLYRILSYLLNSGSINAVLKTLKEHHLKLLILLCKAAATQQNYSLFAHIANELARACSHKSLCHLIDFLLVHELTDYASTILKQVNGLTKRNPTASRLAKLTLILAHLHSLSRRDVFSPLSADLLSRDLANSVFDQIISRNDYPLMGAMVLNVAASEKQIGLAALLTMLSTGGIDSKTLDLIFRAGLEEGISELNKASSGSLQPQNIANCCTALLELRTFITSNQRGVHPETMKILASSLDNRFDQLTCMSVVYLSGKDRLDEVCDLVLELCIFKKSDCLSALILQLVDDQFAEALAAITRRLIDSDKISIAVWIVFLLAENHTFAARTVTAEFIRQSTNKETIFILLNELADINPKLTDLIIRQQARKDDCSLLQEVAVEIALKGKPEALHLVLNQLASYREFVEFAKELARQVKGDRVETLAVWLAKHSLHEVIEEGLLESQKISDNETAAAWKKHLPDR